jgi:hypothetical protein
MKVENATVNCAVKRCKVIARHLGGDIKVIDHLKFDSKLLTPCPFSNNLGVNWEKKIVYVSMVAAGSDIHGIIHEMGHVFASRKPPANSKEYDFFGWEYVVAISIGALFEWDKGSYNYYIDDSCLYTWGKLSVDKKDALIRERLEYAAKNKIVSKSFKPLSIR